MNKDWGPVIVSFLLTIPLFAMEGAILSKMWEWFVVPLGLPEIGIAHAMGLGMLLSFAASSKTSDERETITWDDVRDNTIHGLTVLSTYFAMALVAYLLMVSK